ncbi:GMC family oxidoreductase [Tsuneonella sp. HG222]
MGQGYDYIVIGSGSSGAVVAARLSEDPACSVLLLEAGPRDLHPLQLVPLAFPRVALGRFGTWQFQSEPEAGLNGRRLPVPRGRVLGGTSSINAMIAIRGNHADYDGWQLPGWSFEEVLPYFRKLETSWRGADEWHGADGPVAISPMAGPDLLWEATLEAAEAAGIPYCPDANGAEQDGISQMESTIGGGRRSSVARAYLAPAKERANLRVETGALVQRIVVESGRAVAVDYLQKRQALTAHAGTEIILCGGAIGSPQILLLSGIGPADEVRAAGVTPVHDLPAVGRNLAEHPNIINEHELKDDLGLTRHLRLDRAARAALQWRLTGGGPFSYTGTLANVFMRSLPGLQQPDVQLMLLPMSGDARMWLPGQKPFPARLSARCGFLQPQSRGSVKLRSPDPWAAPEIRFNMFSEPGDLDGMVRALELSRSIYAQKPLRDLITHEVKPTAGTADLRDFIRRNALTRSHPVGTCRMGNGEDAVVDSQLRLRGIDGLRVADASIMPAITSGNTNLPCIMIGEKCADLLRGRSVPLSSCARAIRTDSPALRAL